MDGFASRYGPEEYLAVGGKERGRSCEGIYLDGKESEVMNDRELDTEIPDSLVLSAMLRVRRRSAPVGEPQVRGYGEWPKPSEAWLGVKRRNVI